MNDPCDLNHQIRTQRLALQIARNLGIVKEEQLKPISIASRLHDIGKISIPSDILLKPGKLTDSEFAVIRMHPEIGCAAISRVNFPWPIAEIILEHHENMDGSGYPRGLKGQEIRFEAKIIRVADTIDAMASDRAYRAAQSKQEIISELNRGKGLIYCKEICEAAIAYLTAES